MWLSAKKKKLPFFYTIFLRTCWSVNCGFCACVTNPRVNLAVLQILHRGACHCSEWEITGRFPLECFWDLYIQTHTHTCCCCSAVCVCVCVRCVMSVSLCSHTAMFMHKNTKQTASEKKEVIGGVLRITAVTDHVTFCKLNRNGAHLHPTAISDRKCVCVTLFLFVDFFSASLFFWHVTQKLANKQWK